MLVGSTTGSDGTGVPGRMTPGIVFSGRGVPTGSGATLGRGAIVGTGPTLGAAKVSGSGTSGIGARLGAAT